MPEGGFLSPSMSVLCPCFKAIASVTLALCCVDPLQYECVTRPLVLLCVQCVV